MMCEDSFAIGPPLLLEYHEDKRKMLSVSWKPALEMPRHVKIQIFSF